MPVSVTVFGRSVNAQKLCKIKYIQDQIKACISRKEEPKSTSN